VVPRQGRRKRCPIVDTGADRNRRAHDRTHAPVPFRSAGSATLPFFGVDAAVVDDDGNECARTSAAAGHPASVAFDAPHHLWRCARYRKTYWSEIKGCYFAGDGARRDKDGYSGSWPIDDICSNVAGHRLGTSEVESAL